MSLPYYNFGYKGKLGYLPLLEGAFIPFQYFVEVKPVGEVITLQEAKDYLKIDNDDDNALIALMIRGVVDFAQRYTRLTFLTTTYVTYRDFFAPYFLLKETPFQSVESIEYKKNDVFTVIAPSVYYATRDNHYASVLLKNGQSWPSDGDTQLQSIKVLFKAGFGDDSSDIPPELILAMLQHLAKLYEDRGDCEECGCVETALPSQALLIYDTFRVRDLGVTTQIG